MLAIMYTQLELWHLVLAALGLAGILIQGHAKRVAWQSVVDEKMRNLEAKSKERVRIFDRMQKIERTLERICAKLGIEPVR